MGAWTSALRILGRVLPVLVMVSLAAFCTQKQQAGRQAAQVGTELNELFVSEGVVSQGVPAGELPRLAQRVGAATLNRLLYQAADRYSLQALQWLVKQGADPAVAGQREALPLLLKSAQLPRLDRLGYFLELGLDPGQRSSDGRTVLHVAAAGGLDDAVLQLLLGKGLDVNEATPQGLRPLHLAAARSVVPLVSAGADLEARDHQGRTALHHAAYHGRHDVVAELLRVNASVYATDRQGRTPLHLAYLRNRSQVVDELLAAGAPQSVRDHDNRTPAELNRAAGPDPYRRP